MLAYVLALFAGLGFGIMMPAGFMSKIKNILFNIALITLLFFMGVSLGRDKDILSKIGDFGLTSAVMSISVVIFSIISVLIVTKVFKRVRK